MKYQCYFGDIHNHCNASYGHGDPEDALRNARLQLDFTSITGHSSWPDIPERKPPLESLVDYHVNGFARLEDGWQNFVDLIKSYNRPGQFVAFPSYEIHSMADGDYTIYFQRNLERMLKPRSIPELQKNVLEERARGGDAFIVPHHIGYKNGFRGINWDSFREETSPVVEIVSMHGCSESDQAAFPYLHTMGPRNGRNTMQAGLSRGYHFGVTGSTDHHSAHPGSHGYGRVAVWAEELTDESIWSALINRRCYAVTGDKIILNYSLNGSVMGQVLPFVKEREHRILLAAGDSLDYVELLKNNSVVKRFDFPANQEAHKARRTGKARGKLFIEAGWGDRGVRAAWDIRIRIGRGDILGVEPRLHGFDTVDPNFSPEGSFHFSRWDRQDREIRLTTQTFGNPNTLTNTNQGICLEISGTSETEIAITANSKTFQTDIRTISESSDSFYLKEFLSGAVHVHRFVPESEYRKELGYSDSGYGRREDFYYVRVRQRNGQWAYSTPIWVKAR
ncbi:MAG TPA: hypothetical protein VMX75_02325 [Spirochaetia bacterium]|nr:hypothetical protein [Spirochaetia bacterium]